MTLVWMDWGMEAADDEDALDVVSFSLTKRIPPTTLNLPRLSKGAWCNPLKSS